MDHSNMMWQMELQLYGSQQYANGSRGGGHQLIDLCGSPPGVKDGWHTELHC